MKLIPFKPEHIAQIEVQNGQQDYKLYWTPEYAAFLQTNGQAFTGIENGAVIGCAGISLIAEGRGVAWALLSGWSGQHFIAIHRAAMHCLAISDLRRIEAYVRHDFDKGHKWVKKLGFQLEGCMRKYGTDGSDYDLYSRVGR